MAVQLNLKVYPEGSGQIRADPPPVVDWPWGRTWWDNNTTITLEAVPNQGYSFDHWEVTGTPITGDRRNPTRITATLDLQGQTVKCFMSEAGKPPSDVNYSAQLEYITVTTPKGTYRIYPGGGSAETTQNSDVSYSYQFKNIQNRVIGYRFALQTISDEPGKIGSIIYDPSTGYSLVSPGESRVLTHVTHFIKYGATVRAWLEADKNGSPVTAVNEVRFRVNTGVPPPSTAPTVSLEWIWVLAAVAAVAIIVYYWRFR